MVENITPQINEAGLTNTLDRIDLRILAAQRSAATFGRLMTDAFSQSVIGGRSFEDVLKSLTLRLSDMALKAAFKPIETGLVRGLGQLFGSSTQIAAAGGAIKPFASGGIIGTPSYFPLREGGIGLAGEAGPEAIMPLTRGADGKLGVVAAGGGRANITVNISTPDADSFRRSEIYLTGQIARAVARGQRGL
jgi:phage-related minor tail protein